MIEDLFWKVVKLQGKRLFFFSKDIKWERKNAWSKHQRAAYKKALWSCLGQKTQGSKVRVMKEKQFFILPQLQPGKFKPGPKWQRFIVRGVVPNVK